MKKGILFVDLDCTFHIKS